MANYKIKIYYNNSLYFKYFNYKKNKYYVFFNIVGVRNDIPPRGYF